MEWPIRRKMLEARYFKICLQGAVIADQFSVRTDITEGSTPMGPLRHQNGRKNRYMNRYLARRLAAGSLAAALFFGLTAISLFGLTAVASAQGAVRSVHGDWQIRCDP